MVSENTGFTLISGNVYIMSIEPLNRNALTVPFSR